MKGQLSFAWDAFYKEEPKGQVKENKSMWFDHSDLISASGLDISCDKDPAPVDCDQWSLLFFLFCVWLNVTLLLINQG